MKQNEYFILLLFISFCNIGKFIIEKYPKVINLSCEFLKLFEANSKFSEVYHSAGIENYWHREILWLNSI